MSRGVRIEPEPGDLTGVSGGVGDVAPLGRDMPKPNHERTADEDVDPVDWEAVAASAEFKQLLAEKAKFIIPATIFFFIYYLLLPILDGYAPDLMKTKVIGDMNLAYLFALSQFFMTWIIAFLYLSKASTFDQMAANIAGKLGLKKEGK